MWPALVLVVLAAACAPTPPAPPVSAPAPEPETETLRPVGFDALPGWGDDSLPAAFAAFRRSCPRIAAGDPATPVGQGVAARPRGLWAGACAAAERVPPADIAAIRQYFETRFEPFLVQGDQGPEGLFTGYFEAALRASRTADARYPVPIYGRPADHVTVDLRKFGADLPAERISGRVVAGSLEPYPTRGDIQAGAVRGPVLFWGTDPVSVFLLHVQGSGRLTLPDGSVARVGYAADNGRPYASIGRALIDRGALPEGGANWPAIDAWVRANPAEASALLAANPRYIFFRELSAAELSPDLGPVGALGVPLTPGHSLAVDRRFMPLGAPVWLDTTWPNTPDRPLRRLMVAQDTGGAIKGTVRGDFFWGTGEAALREAGRMRSRGRYFLLLPRPLPA